MPSGSSRNGRQSSNAQISLGQRSTSASTLRTPDTRSSREPASTPRTFHQKRKADASSRASTRYASERTRSSAPPRSDIGTATNASTGQASQAEHELEDDLDSFNEVIMAVDMKSRGEIGCTYYVAREETLYFMEEVKSGSVDIVDGCKSWHPQCLFD